MSKRRKLRSGLRLNAPGPSAFSPRTSIRIWARFTKAPFLPALLGPTDVVIDRIISIEPNVPPEGWSKFYTDAIKSIQPGVTEMIVHIAYDDEEMRAATIDHPNWGAGWRQRD